MLGVIFPGQGSQHVGMGKFLCEAFDVARKTFDEASDTLSIDFKKLCFFADEKDLTLTYNTQPALLVTSVATYRVLQETNGIEPSAGAGHSVGEYAAAVTSGALAFTDAVKLVRKRGEAMQEAVPVGKGSMLAIIGLTEPEVEKMCAWAQETSRMSPIEPANFNSPQQIVVSGSTDLINWTRENFSPVKIGSTASKVRLIPLNVSAPFHCSMMEKAQQVMDVALNTVRWEDAVWPIAQNIDGQVYTEGTSIRDNLVAQVTGSVKWTHCMNTLRNLGIETMIECGPSKVLTGLLKKIDTENHPSFNVNSLDDIKKIEQELRQ